eukprot:3207690-Pleurochrysis_carterae.AAC.4
MQVWMYPLVDERDDRCVLACRLRATCHLWRTSVVRASRCRACALRAATLSWCAARCELTKQSCARTCEPEREVLGAQVEGNDHREPLCEDAVRCNSNADMLNFQAGGRRHTAHVVGTREEAGRKQAGPQALSARAQSFRIALREADGDSALVLANARDAGRHGRCGVIRGGQGGADTLRRLRMSHSWKCFLSRQSIEAHGVASMPA